MTGSNRMAAKPKKAAPSWSDVKARLAEFDRTALLGLVQDLYAASKDNQAFLHARFGLGGDVLDPYKATIDRWLWPDVHRNQDVSVSKAKKAIADYKKASGRTKGLAELTVFFCERAASANARRVSPGNLAFSRRPIWTRSSGCSHRRSSRWLPCPTTSGK